MPGQNLWDEARLRRPSDGAEIVLGPSARATPAAFADGPLQVGRG